MNSLDLVAIAAFAALAAWDTARRFFSDRRQAREFEKQLSSQLTKELVELVPYLRERQKVADSALSAFLGQMKELVGFTEEARRTAEKKVISATMGKRT